MIQLDTVWHSKSDNYVKAESLIKEAAAHKCDIAVLPEMFNTGFSMEIEKTGEQLHGATSEFLKRTAAKHKMAIIAGYPALEDGEKGRNVAAVIDDGGNIVAEYFKVFPFSYVGEHLHYASGVSPTVFSIEGMKASVFICYDLRFPEVFRRVARSVECIFVIANWPEPRIEHWSALLKARAIENQCFLVGVNRIGSDGNGLSYCGNSHVFSPDGDVLCTGSAQDELVVADIDLEQVKKIRRQFPFLDDMRITDEVTYSSDMS
ncbi:carbon-nitrogen family hydrolase [Chloroflexota bacterium]